jgi:hypothetical protein
MFEKKLLILILLTQVYLCSALTDNKQSNPVTEANTADSTPSVDTKNFVTQTETTKTASSTTEATKFASSTTEAKYSNVTVGGLVNRILVCSYFKSLDDNLSSCSYIFNVKVITNGTLKCTNPYLIIECCVNKFVRNKGKLFSQMNAYHYEIGFKGTEESNIILTDLIPDHGEDSAFCKKIRRLCMICKSKFTYTYFNFF